MIDTVDRLLKSTLDALCPNVARLFFRGKAGTYITYQLVSSEDMAAADDEMHGTEYTYRVDIYSKRDYIALLRRVKQALKAAGFYGLVIDPEVYEQDTGFYRAPITVGEGGEETYGTPVRMAKAISAEMSVEVAEAILYADDGADEVVKEFVSGELTLNVNDLMPADLAAILGQTQDDDQVVYAGENDDPPYMAIGFRAKKANGMYKYIWLYKVKFAIPSESYQTKGDSIEFTTPEITGQFIKRPDGLWKAEHVALPTETAAQGWFTKVREQNNTSGG